MLAKSFNQLGVRKLGALGYFVSTLLFAVSFVTLFVFLSSLLGLICYNLPFPLKMIDFSTIFALYFSTLASSFIIAKISGGKYFLRALFSSLILITFFTITYLIGKKNLISFDFILRQGSVLFCFLGTFLGRKRQKVSKRRHKR